MDNYFPKQEEIEKDSDTRLAHQPVQHLHLYKFYKELEASFWTDEDVDKDLVRDAADYQKVSAAEKRLFERVQGFFAVSDFVVGDLISEKLSSRIKNADVKIVYSFIGMMENIHMITYSKVLEKSITDNKQRMNILQSASKIPTINKKINWIKKWVGMENDIHNLDYTTIKGIFELTEVYNKMLKVLHPEEDIQNYKSPEIIKLEEKLKESIPSLDRIIIVLAITEAIFFSGSFAVIFWFAQSNLFPGACKANQLIKNDEGKHVENGALIHRTLIENKEAQQLVYEMIQEAIEIENDFMMEAMPTGLKGMNSELMLRYVKYCADWMLDLFGYEKLYNIRFEDTFDFMIKQSITDTFTDFFKSEEVNYKVHGVDETAFDKQTVFDDDLDDM